MCSRKCFLAFLYTDKKENKIFLIYKSIQMGSGAKSYMRKGFLMYEEMRKYFPIYEEAGSPIWLCTRSLLISSYMRKILFSFNQCMHAFNTIFCQHPFILSVDIFLWTKNAKKKILWRWHWLLPNFYSNNYCSYLLSFALIFLFSLLGGKGGRGNSTMAKQCGLSLPPFIF